jgi:ABC-2 type transport system permease protein
MRGTATLSQVLVIGYLRDKASLFFTLIFPLMFLVLLGGLFGGAGGNHRVKVVVVGAVDVFDALPDAQRAQIDQALAISRSPDLAAALDEVRDGDQVAAVVQDGTRIVVHYSLADQASAATVRNVVQSLAQAANLTATGQPARFSVAAEVVEDQSLKQIQYLTPGILGWAIATGATFGAASTLVVWRQRRLMRRLALSPVGVPAVVGARIAVSLGLALVQTVLFLAIAAAFFGLKLTGSWWLAIPLVLAASLAFLSVGLLAGAAATSVEAANAVCNVVVIPMAFLSGSFVPLSFAPPWLQNVSLVLPLRQFNDGMQDVLSRGGGIGSLAVPMAVLLGFAAVLTAVSIRLVRLEAD